MKNIFFAFLFVMSLTFGIPGIANAISITNGSFEYGFTGWNLPTPALGDGVASVVTSSTADDGTVYHPIGGGSYFAEITATSSIFQKNLSWDVGDKLTFDWAFLAFDYTPYNDRAIFKVKESSGSVLDSITLSDVATVGGYGDTGWQSYEYTFASAGSGKIIFKSKNYYDELYDSVFLVDKCIRRYSPRSRTCYYCTPRYRSGWTCRNGSETKVQEREKAVNGSKGLFIKLV